MTKENGVDITFYEYTFLLINFGEVILLTFMFAFIIIELILTNSTIFQYIFYFIVMAFLFYINLKLYRAIRSYYVYFKSELKNVKDVANEVRKAIKYCEKKHGGRYNKLKERLGL